MPKIKSPNNNHLRVAFGIALLLFFAAVLLLNAWMVDDAYITFRTVDNFVNGRGLIWNPGERVQVYTHPLWMFVVSLFYFFTSELFFTVIILSLLLTLAAVWIVARYTTSGFRLSLWKVPLLLFALLSSKAFVDYASSGLENCLSYLIAALFLVMLMSLQRDGDRFPQRDFSLMFFLASLAFVNRFDTILLYLPALAYLIWIYRHAPRLSLVRNILLASSPAILWILFSIAYYGTPFPNTAYAKDFSTGFPLAWKVQSGLDYLAYSFAWDFPSYLIFAGSIWLAIKHKNPLALTLLAGIMFYAVFVVLSAASATHMGGRFFAVPFFIAIAVYVSLASSLRAGLAIGMLLVSYIAYSPMSALKFGTSFYKPYNQRNWIDTKWIVANEGAALINWKPGKAMPDHLYYHEGERVREQPLRVVVGGPFGKAAIGYFGFAAGPAIYIIDNLGLADPLLSRLPAVQPENVNGWRPGHFYRNIPDGYIQSLENGRNLIRDADLRQYYDAVRIITRGPLFRTGRLKTIWNMNTGKYDNLIQRYTERAPDTKVSPMDAYNKGDYKIAMAELMRLAENGDPMAQQYVGFMYDNGQGVPTDYGQAAFWYGKAAEQGNSISQHNLGMLYGLGLGVKQDWVQALKWLDLAVKTSNSTYDQAINDGKIAAARMTPAQIQDAEKLADQWLIQHGTPVHQ